MTPNIDAQIANAEKAVITATSPLLRVFLEIQLTHLKAVRADIQRIAERVEWSTNHE